MLGLLSTLIWAVAIVYSVAMIAGWLRNLCEKLVIQDAQRTAAFETLRREALPAITELLTTISERLKPVSGPDETPEPMPAALQKWINRWDDPWAIEGQNAYANELYKQHKDWARVASIMKQEEDEAMRGPDEA